MSLFSFLQILAVTVGIVVGAGGSLATIWAVGKVKGVETSIDLLSSANDALRAANDDLRVELVHSERVCADRLSRLEGQNAALLDGLGDKFAQAIAGRLESVLNELARNIAEGVHRHRPEGAMTRATDYAEEIARRDHVARDSTA